MNDRYYNDRHDRFTTAQENDVILWPYWLALALVGVALWVAAYFTIANLLLKVARVIA